MHAAKKVSATLLASILTVLIGGCTSSTVRTSNTETDRFDKIQKEFLETHFEHRPIAAVGLGWHQHDGRFILPTAAAIAEEDRRLHQARATLSELQFERLDPQRKRDRDLLQIAIAGELWSREQQRAYYRNPLTYTYGLDVSIYLQRDFKPLPERIRDIATILGYAPEFLSLARTHLERVLPLPWVETAIRAAEGTASFLEKDVVQAAAEVSAPDIHARLNTTLPEAVTAFREYAEWLKREKLPLADASFALGRAAYRAMLQLEEIDMEPKQILEIGMRELRAEQERFRQAATVLDPNLSPVEAARVIQRDHPTAEGLIPDTRKKLEEIRQFLIDHQIITVPSEVRAQVKETLPPFRATSFASMSTPGPFETRATDAYYYVTPVEPEWSDAQKEEWLGAFNYYTTDIVSIHEAYPGHYVQFLALNASRASTVAKIFPSYAFAEGWAHYTEQMMIEEGFEQVPSTRTASREEQVRAARYRIAQSTEALLRLCRLCCSIRLHTQGMTVDEATRFFVENCYYEEKPARFEAIRGTFDPGYLVYTLGKLMILKLRQDWQAQEGPRYSLKRFHDEFLSHGAPPVPMLRRIMLKDPASWPNLL